MNFCSFVRSVELMVTKKSKSRPRWRSYYQISHWGLGGWPLNCPFFQKLITNSRNVNICSSCSLCKFFINFAEIIVVEFIAPTHFFCKTTNNLCIGKSFAWGINHFTQMCNSSFSIGHCAFFFCPSGSRKHNIGKIDSFSTI